MQSLFLHSTISQSDESNLTFVAWEKVFERASGSQEMPASAQKSASMQPRIPAFLSPIFGSQWAGAGPQVVAMRCNLRRKRPQFHAASRPSATAASYGRTSTNVREDPSESNRLALSEKRWRSQNAFLVNEAEKHGVDAAIEVLWRMTKDGEAVTQNYNQVVSLLANHHRLDEGLALAEEAGKRGMANIITFRPLMKYCCAHGDGKAAKRVWNTMARYGIDGDMFLYAELMGALVRSQDLMSAHKVLNSLLDSGRRPHIVLYNTLMKGYARKADIKRGFDVFRMIENSNVKPDETVCLIATS